MILEKTLKYTASVYYHGFKFALTTHMAALFMTFKSFSCGCRHYDPCLLRSFPLSVSQRIAAADLAAGLQYFGRSIHGTMDMNNDGSVDLAVGSLGAAVLLWLVFHPVNNTAIRKIQVSHSFS